jgi:hypothetical protein
MPSLFSICVHSEKESAAKTALLLNGAFLLHLECATRLPNLTSSFSTDGTLDGAHLSVTSESISNAPSVSGEEPISQEDKPKSAIIAEYLAHGESHPLFSPLSGLRSDHRAPSCNDRART